MTADDLTRLRAVAEAATLYPNRPENGWMIDPDDDTIILAPKQSNGWDGIAICREVIRIEDAHFIATFDPPTVAALIDRVERAERERDLLQTEVNTWIENDQISFARATRLDDEITALRAAVAGLADEAQHAMDNAPWANVNWERGYVDLLNRLRGLLTEGADDGQ